MPDPRYPTLEEFWKRLDLRGVEDDLKVALRARTYRERERVKRVGAEGTVLAVAAQLLPGAVPAAALAAFLDHVFDQQLGRADDRLGVLPRALLIPAGFAVLDEAAGPAGFAALEDAAQVALLERAERGELAGPDGFDASEWFKRVRELLLRGFGADPRGMVQMGFPGPSYATGHIWLDQMEVERRAERAPGYMEL